MTSDPVPLVATCGGTFGGDRTTCLVLDTINQRWDESKMGSLSMPRINGAVAELKFIGVFYLGGTSTGDLTDTTTTTDFLATGSLQWTQGPTLPFAMSHFCAVPITQSSFITIHRGKVHEFDAAIAGPTSNEGWRESGRWGTLKTGLI